jgi:hypothetical protein
MSHLAKAVSTAAAAALLAACPVVAGAADAHPASSHRHTHSHTKTHTNTHRHGVADKLTGPRRGAAHAIGAQLKAVRALVNRAADLTIGRAADLGGDLAADAAAVQSDLDAVAGAGSVRGLHTLMMAANTTRQLARVQFEVVVAADALIAQADALDATIDSLVGPLFDIDASAGLATLDAAAATLDAVRAQAAGAISYVLDVLTATSPRADVNAEAENWDALKQALSDSLAAAADTIAAVQAEYGL